jgi:hypothetical protein
MSIQAGHRRTSPGTTGNVSGPLNVTPNGATENIAQVENRAPPGKRRNKTPVYVSGVRNMRKFLEWIRTKSACKQALGADDRKGPDACARDY